MQKQRSAPQCGWTESYNCAAIFAFDNALLASTSPGRDFAAEMADPLSVAASAAGLASLAFQLFGGCIQGFVLLSTARNLRKDAATIVCMLDLQELHLTDWARQAGLLSEEGTLDPRLNARLVERTLERLRDLLLDSDKLRKRYGLHLEEAAATSPTNEDEEGENEQLEDLRVLTGVSDNLRRKILARAGTQPGIRNPFKRLRWAAVDKDNIKSLVTDVRDLVRELWYLLEPWQHDNIKKIGTNVVALNGRFDQLMAFVEALGPAPAKNAAGLPAIGEIARLKALRVGLDDEETGQDQSSRPKLLASLEPLSRGKLAMFQALKRSPSMGMAEYDGQSVFVEHKPLEPQTRRKILPRAQNLAALLNLPKAQTFRSLQCRGLIEEVEQVAFVFDVPGTMAPAKLRALVDLFSAKDGIEPPSLTDRMELALQLARAVQDFHRAGWFHKSLRSENILFFPLSTAASSPRELLKSPYLAGFAFSRFGSPTEISEQPSAEPKHDIYRHPAALGEPTTSFSALMDVYSLGCVLLEIAEWRALRFLVDSVVNVDAENVALTDIANVRPFLLKGDGKGGTSKMKAKMGDIYFEACLLCLKGQIHEPSPEITELEQPMLKPSLLDIVVKKLESCKV
jgi:hypothetical protein